MNEKQEMLNRYLVKIAEKLDISETMREKAEHSYESVGLWLQDCEQCKKNKIMPQGSFYLGTVIRPVTDNDEYDIDLICLLEETKNLSACEIKNIVGDRLKEHGSYKNMLKPEGKRCWTLEYDEFHMDILPCIPGNDSYEEPSSTQIKLTHKLENNNYIFKYSNPYKYHEWFEERMKFQLNEAKNEYYRKYQVDIKEIPLYKVKTPSQRSIQLLKRHRDIIYDKLSESRKENAPISIIITTLAARAYDNESSVYEALNNILNNMEKFIEKKDGEYTISNPVMNEENFADKWNEYPQKATEFYFWLKAAKRDILDTTINACGLKDFSNKLEHCFGENIVKKVFVEAGNSMKEARENQSLYVDGLTGGLNTVQKKDYKKVEEHTFFGK